MICLIRRPTIRHVNLVAILGTWSVSFWDIQFSISMYLSPWSFFDCWTPYRNYLVREWAIYRTKLVSKDIPVGLYGRKFCLWFQNISINFNVKFQRPFPMSTNPWAINLMFMLPAVRRGTFKVLVSLAYSFHLWPKCFLP